MWTCVAALVPFMMSAQLSAQAQDAPRARFMVVSGPGIAHAVDRGLSTMPVLSGRILYRFDHQHAAMLEGSVGWQREVAPEGCLTSECRAYFGDRHRLGSWFIGLESDIVAPRIAGRRIDSRLVAGIGQAELLSPNRPVSGDRRGETDVAVAVGATLETAASRRVVLRADTHVLLSRAPSAHLAAIDGVKEIVYFRLGAGYGF